MFPYVKLCMCVYCVCVCVCIGAVRPLRRGSKLERRCAPARHGNRGAPSLEHFCSNQPLSARCIIFHKLSVLEGEGRGRSGERRGRRFPRAFLRAIPARICPSSRVSNEYQDPSPPFPQASYNRAGLVQTFCALKSDACSSNNELQFLRRPRRYA